MPTAPSAALRRQASSQKRTQTRPQVAAIGYLSSTTPSAKSNLPFFTPSMYLGTSIFDGQASMQGAVT